MNINNSNNNSSVGGNYIFNNTLSGSMNLYDNANVKFGTTIQSDNTRTYGSTTGTMTVSGTGVKLNTQNTRIDTNSVHTLKVSNPIKLVIDVSLADTKADNISNSVTAVAKKYCYRFC